MTEAPPHNRGGRFGLRRAVGALVGLARNRLELFALEWEEEKERLLRFAARLTCFLVLGAAGVVLLLGLVAWVAYQVLNAWGVLAVALICLGGSILGLRRLISEVREGPGPFAQTVAEFRKDTAWLNGEDPRRNESKSSGS